MDKPQVDSIEGIPPAIAIEQRNAVKTTRSTVGTMTEICEHMKLLWPHVSKLHCRKCGQTVRKDSPQLIWTQLNQSDKSAGREVLITFALPATEKLTNEETLSLIAKQGYQRVLLNGQVKRLDELAQALKSSDETLRVFTIIQDRLKVSANLRARFVEACEQAYHFGKGLLAIYPLSPASGLTKDSSLEKPLRFSNRLHCAPCGIDYREATPALFSFNHPVGACPSCRGFGRVISIDYNLAVPDRSKTLSEGVVKPWMNGHGRDSHFDLMKVCKQFGIPTNVPFAKLSAEWQKFVVEGDPEHGEAEENQWPHKWYGVKGYFRWLESKAYKMHVRVLLSRYRSYTPCPACEGRRFQPDTLLYLLESNDSRFSHLNLADFYLLPVQDAAKVLESLAAARPVSARDPLSMVIEEVRSRLRYLEQVGLGYLTLDRPTKTLSGGETERVNLTTCLGTRLVNTLFVLDEPSVGLHPRDTDRLVKILEQLRDCGNTVVVVEHEPNVMLAADQIVDIGPGHGASGGEVVFQGPLRGILKSKTSLTGAYLSGRQKIEITARRPVLLEEKPNRFSPEALNDAMQIVGTASETTPALRVEGASCHNLKNISVTIPLGRFVCLTGVSGSGKTTLLRDVLLPGLGSYFRPIEEAAEESDSENTDKPDAAPGTIARNSVQLGRLTIDPSALVKEVVLVDQSALGKTPRSNPAVYIGAFEDIREFFAQSEMALQRGLGASAFSFNSPQGQCQRCRGAGFEKIEMQFLSDIFIRCGECKGRRYRPHILDIKVRPSSGADRLRAVQHLGGSAEAGWSIADVLDSTVDETVAFLRAFPESRPAVRAVNAISLLQDVGLGYLKLGQPINTLSGGESQRLKLVRHLATVSFSQPQPSSSASTINVSKSHNNRSRVADLLCRPGMEKVYLATPGDKKTLFLFDEPTTGLHFDDVRILLKVFQRLVDAGHSVVVIEHNLELIKSADWVIDLGPEAGDQGGELVAQGTPEEVALCPESHTGRALRPLLPAFAKTARGAYKISRRVSPTEDRLILKE
jgi:excinuclease ABC subunit A